MTPKRLPTLALAALLAAALAGRADAQLSTAAVADRVPSDMMGDQLVLLMRQALAGDTVPSADQLVRAGVLLGLAIELSPQNPDLYRLAAELAELRGRPEDRQRALAKYVRLVPTDDAAQLELIVARVAQAQTLDQRVEMLGRLLDSDAGRSLSAPLRSRLASLAASAAKETGNRAVYVSRLKQALKLDAANGEAARLLYLLATDESESPLHHGAAAIAWVRGEPANPEARVTLGKLLLEQGVFDEATRQFAMAANVTGRPPGPEVLRLWASSIAMGGQADQALALLSQAEGAAGGAGLPTDLEIVRLAILAGSQRRDETRVAYERFAQRLASHVQAGNDAAVRELAVAGALFGQNLDGLADSLPPSTPEPLQRLVRGWIAVHRGDPQGARDLLKPTAEAEVLAALGIAAVESDEASRATILETIRGRDTSGVGELMATMELRRIRGEVAASREGQSLRDYLTRWPSRVWYTDLAWSPWLSMRVEVDPPRIQYLAPLTGVVEIRNLAGVPVSVGPGATVATQMLVSVTPSVLGQPQATLPPIIVDIGLTLTIADGGTLRVPFRLDYSPLGDLLADTPTEPIDVQATAVLDPVAAGTGVRPGPIGAMDTNRATSASAKPVTPENVQTWIAGVESGDAAERMRSIARLLDALGSDAIDETQRRQASDAIGTRFKDWDRVMQAWTLRFLPPAERRGDALKRAAELAQRSLDPLVRLTYLSSQVKSADSPELIAALREQDPLVGEFARALRTSLREAAPAAPQPATP